MVFLVGPLGRETLSDANGNDIMYIGNSSLIDVVGE